MLTNQPLAPSLQLRFYPESTLRKALVESPLKILSRDLIRTIFCYLRDIKSVKHVRRACRLFYVDSESRLVKLLAHHLNLPVKENSLLADFRPAVRLKNLLTEFINQYVTINLTQREVCFSYRDKSSCEKEFEKMTWHLTIHQNSEQPFIKKNLFLLDHRSSCLNIKLGVALLTRLPQGHWLRGIKIQENCFLQMQLNRAGKVNSTSDVLPLKDNEKMWLASYDPYQELEVLIDQMHSDLQEMQKLLKKLSK